MIHGHPPLIEFSSSLIKLEYYVNLSCLHLHQCTTVTRPYTKYYLAFALPIPTQSLTVDRLRGRPAGSVCVNTSTRRELSAFEQNTGYTTVTDYRYQSLHHPMTHNPCFQLQLYLSSAAMVHRRRLRRRHRRYPFATYFMYLYHFMNQVAHAIPHTAKAYNYA